MWYMETIQAIRYIPNYQFVDKVLFLYTDTSDPMREHKTIFFHMEHHKKKFSSKIDHFKISRHLILKIIFYSF